MDSKLIITTEHSKIGELTFKVEEDKFFLEYDESWSSTGYPLSPHIPLKKKVSSVSLRRYLENQFPEGKGLEILLEEFRIGRGNIFRIIQVIGQETTGALKFNNPEAAEATTTFRELGNEELIKRLDNRRNQGLVIWDGKPRLSVAGVQDKLPITILSDGSMGFGEGDLASTHIMKFQTTNEKIPFLVLNEFFCMKLAKQIGIEVAEVEYKKIGPHPILFVKRFDRVLENDKRVFRKHVIDGCQALDLPSSHKYERNFGSGRDVAHIRDGATFQRIFKFCLECQTPATAVLATIKWLIFNLCISNADSHAKNLSFFINPDGIKPTPAYDLVNISMYQEIEQEIALSIGNEFDLKQIKGFQMLEFCKDNEINHRLFVNTFRVIAKSVLQNINSIDVTFLDLNKKEIDFIEKIKVNIRVSTEELLKSANEMMKM
jgi:serine/threonine-protein kinase HipA